MLEDVRSAADTPLNTAPDINPANGLPMIGAVDVEGNPYEFDSFADPFDDWSGGGMSSFDSFGSGSGFSDDW